ncbi:hypothetical protein PHMEG_00026121, partial [Phytophthora megakarya]
MNPAISEATFLGQADTPPCPPLTLPAAHAHVPSTVTSHLVAAFDGGFRRLTDRSAYAWTTAHVFGDSEIIINQALMQSDCKAVHLSPYVAAIRSLGAGMPLIYLRHVRREFNVCADALCNWIMNVITPGNDTTRRGNVWPGQLPSSQAQSPAILLSFIPDARIVAADRQAHLHILDGLVAIPHLGIAGTLRLFRGQTSDDPRPNKALRPWLYREHLHTYPQLPLLCAIASDGIVPPWTNPATRRGVRPLPDNYGGAESGATVVTDKLLADYYKGRCLVASLDTLQQDPRFHSSSFTLVPKKNKPIHLDGRIIHDLSAPPGRSVNDQTNSEASPDATWDPFDSIARRIRDLRHRYPGYIIYAMVADIADAFHHVPIHADHASAFGGRMPRSNHGIISGMAVFGWTSSPGFFAVFGKAVRHYQRTGSSRVLGYSEPFWIFQWVDDIVLVEVDIDDRLQKAERRLRDGVKLVFGSDGWHEGKFTTWSQSFHAVGIDWDILNEFITVPQRKINKMRNVLDDTARRKFVTMKQLDNKMPKASQGWSTTLQKDIQWWQQLVFQNEFAGIPMELFERKVHIDDIWVIQVQQNGLAISSMVLKEQLHTTFIDTVVDEVSVSITLEKVTKKWGPRLAVKNAWRHVNIHNTERRRRIEEKTVQLKEAAITKGTLGRYSKNFKFWESFCNDFGFPVWIDKLPRAQQARMVGLYAGLCASEGHNKSRTGNKYQTFDGKMAAVAFAHKAVRNAKLNYRDPEFELIAQGYKRSNSQVERKQPVTTPMLLEMRKRLEPVDDQGRLLWGSIVLTFFFLVRSSELWGPVSTDNSTGVDRAHCVKAHNVILRDKQGHPVSPGCAQIHSVELLFESHKGDRIAQ